MITSISIENFKSIQSLGLELGRLNVFIGANGSGKSNILEAIAMGSAAMEDKLDDEFLVNRGVRVTENKWMKSRFDKTYLYLPICIDFSNEKISLRINIAFIEGKYSEWQVKKNIGEKSLTPLNDRMDFAQKFLLENTPLSDMDKRIEGVMGKKLKSFKKELVKAFGANDKEFMEDFIKGAFIEELLQENNGNDFLNFLIYAPENHTLRRFEEEVAIKPLGIKGEGLFKLITIISQEYPEQFEEINNHLKLIDWFDGFEIPTDLKFTERRIKIIDKYLDGDLQYIDQRSANEGFLYLLFYLTLFVSDLTPHFFAIDNIDNSLNPKLGSELIKVLAKLAKEHNKQALLTTHNPVILDGLDLNDEDQRLFVVYRNADGHTKVRRIPARKDLNGIEPARLSEAFIRGYIGGLPDNF